MTNQPSNSEENRIKAAELYAAACELEARGDYQSAMKSYEQSLELYDDPLVEAAYFKLLSAIGPM